MKADFDIVYKNVIRKSETNQMDFYIFLDSLEVISSKVMKNEPLSESISEVLDMAIEYFESI